MTPDEAAKMLEIPGGADDVAVRSAYARQVEKWHRREQHDPLPANKDKARAMLGSLQVARDTLLANAGGNNSQAQASVPPKPQPSPAKRHRAQNPAANTGVAAQPSIPSPARLNANPAHPLPAPVYGGGPGAGSWVIRSLAWAVYHLLRMGVRATFYPSRLLYKGSGKLLHAKLQMPPASQRFFRHGRGLVHTGGSLRDTAVKIGRAIWDSGPLKQLRQSPQLRAELVRYALAAWLIIPALILLAGAVLAAREERTPRKEIRRCTSSLRVLTHPACRFTVDRDATPYYAPMPRGESMALHSGPHVLHMEHPRFGKKAVCISVGASGAAEARYWFSSGKLEVKP